MIKAVASNDAASCVVHAYSGSERLVAALLIGR
jgi:hypothetical protein